MPGSESELPWIRVILQTLVSPLCIRPIIRMQPKRSEKTGSNPDEEDLSVIRHPPRYCVTRVYAISQEQALIMDGALLPGVRAIEVCGEVHYETQRGNAAW